MNPALDVIRGAAALLVVLGHARGTLMLAQGHPITGAGFQKVLLLPTACGSEAVAVFFVLSGYLVGGHVVDRLRASRFSWADYLSRRLSRLWIVLIPALVLTLAVDMVTHHLSATAYSTVTIQTPGTLGEAACNALFLQTSHCDRYLGSNSALWTLGYEFWFYIAFAGAAVAVVATRRRRAVPAVVGAGALAVALGLFGAHLLWLLPAWLLGVAVARAPRPASAPPSWLIAPGVALILVTMLFTSTVKPSDSIRFLIVGVATCPLMWLVTVRRFEPRFGLDRLAWIGSWSYSLYAFHLPLLALAAVALRDVQVGSVLTVGLIYLVAVLAPVLTYPL